MTETTSSAAYSPFRWPALGRIERYVLVQQLRALAVALGVISALVMLIDFVEVSRGPGSSADLSAVQIFGLVLLKSPAVIVTLLPFVFLFGTLFAYVRLNRRSELIALRAAGVSAWRFVLPAAGMAVAMGVLAVAVLSPLASTADGLWRSERARLTGAAPGVEAAEAIWLREGDAQRQMVIRAAGQDRATGRLLNTTFFIYTTDDEGRRTFNERIDARSAALSSGRWRLVDAVGAQIGQKAVRYATLDLTSNLADREAFDRFARPQSTPFWSLPNQIRRIEDAGFTSTAYRLQFQQGLATPLVFGAMSILAAAFSLRLMRLGDVARMSVFAVVLGFAFFFMTQVSAAMGSAEVVPPVVAAWLPPVLTALAALTLLFYTEDG
ncbi:LptF/LptG family permease [Brevundimonas sp. PAMC22021]|uniref:LptF/LptG family permease n=1 Tax=Brevundimonas sp. PAMC22021 TaxID=2861285 RepID=UPI001C63A61E|nr:LptF/LptG family permease [Brevundimonas sp. PAMC22021]QYF88091.1 LptF/LptG family permease [Brevundimonas sp. PAMC22021]